MIKKLPKISKLSNLNLIKGKWPAIRRIKLNGLINCLTNLSKIIKNQHPKIKENYFKINLIFLNKMELIKAFRLKKIRKIKKTNKSCLSNIWQAYCN